MFQFNLLLILAHPQALKTLPHGFRTWTSEGIFPGVSTMMKFHLANST